MLKIGITGGIGSGKSTVCNFFRNLGVPIFNSDIVAKDLVNDDPKVTDEIRKYFGSDMFFSDGTMDRKRMAQLVFNDAKALERLNSIVHPEVKNKFEEFCKKHHNEKNIYNIKFNIPYGNKLFRLFGHFSKGCFVAVNNMADRR